MANLADEPEYPAMADTDVEAIENLMTYIEPDRILEWGSGGSTIYFSSQFHEEYDEWLAIEHDPDWHDYVRKNIPENTKTVCLSDKKYYSKPLDKYKNYFDLIIVDGIFRRACMVASKQLIRDKGKVLLHDSERDTYDSVMNLYDKNEQITDDIKYEEDNLTFTHKGLRLFYDE